MPERKSITIPERVGEAHEIDYGKPAPPDFGPLARDRIPVRAMKADDLHALIAIDRRIIGRDRSTYFERKLAEVLRESDVRSLWWRNWTADLWASSWRASISVSSVVSSRRPSWIRSASIPIIEMSE